jgi:6-phospho-beta-glucosidase
MKLAVIGGGSTYTPELFEGLIAREAEIGLTEVILEDIDPERLTPVAGFCARMAAAAGAGFTVSSTTDLDQAVSGADIVITQIRVGGQQARLRDEQIPLKYNLIGQETTGPGGFAKALRTIPEILKIAERIKLLAPDAWVVNFTNPSGIITETLIRHGGVKTVGLCNIPMEMKIETAGALGVDQSRVELEYIGLNHLGWIRGIKLDGNDITDTILAGFKGGMIPANIPELDFGTDFYNAIGMIPSPYLEYYYATDEMLARLKTEKSRALVVMDLEKDLFAIYRDPSQHTKPELLSQRGGAWYSRVAIDVISALLGNEPQRHVVNAINGDTIPELPADAVIEAPAMISRHGVKSLPARRLPEEIVGLVRLAKAYERLTIEAATGRSRRKALMALINNPLVRTISAARSILDELIANGDIVPVD